MMRTAMVKRSSAMRELNPSTEAWWDFHGAVREGDHISLADDTAPTKKPAAASEPGPNDPGGKRAISDRRQRVPIG